MSDATVFVSLAFAFVWLKRKGRLSLFLKAADGQVSLASGAIGVGTGSGTVTAGGGSSPSVPSSSGPTTVNPNTGQAHTGTTSIKAQ